MFPLAELKSDINFLAELQTLMGGACKMPNTSPELDRELLAWARVQAGLTKTLHHDVIEERA